MDNKEAENGSQKSEVRNKVNASKKLPKDPTSNLQPLTSKKEILMLYENNTKDILEAQSGNEDVMAKLIEENNGLIWSIVKRFKDRRL